MRPPAARPLGITRSLGRSVRRRHAVVAAGQDGGFSLAEILVAMFVFALVSVGLLHTLTMTLTTTRDSRARQVAANLAASEIDRAREESDLFALVPVTRAPLQVGTDIYHVARQTAWVSDPSADFDCGAGGSGSLRYKRVSILVTWDGMKASTAPVRADTLIDPKERINDPAKGTILVGVLDGAGTGSPGVTVTATPLFPGGVAPAAQVTDAQGCAYLLKVVAGGDYSVNVSRAGYVDVNQATSSSIVVGVAAGTSASAGFQYAEAATYIASYATNTTELNVQRPNNLTTSFVSTTGSYAAAGTVSGADRTFALHPFASGYSAFAGTCTAADPAEWPAATLPNREGQRQSPVAAEPGGAVNVPVWMGIVKVDLGSTTTRSLKAVSTQNVGVGDPGCAATTTLTFGDALTSGQATIALPYGSWDLFYGDSGSSTQATAITAAQMAAVVADPGTASVDAGGTVTFDPRVVIP